VEARFPPVPVTTTLLDGMTLGENFVHLFESIGQQTPYLGDSATFWVSPLAYTFHATLLVGTYPNGTRAIINGRWSDYYTNITLNSDGSLSIPNEANGRDEWCQGDSESDGWVLGHSWVPEVSGNWVLGMEMVLFYNSSPEQYTYPNATKVCINSPLQHEHATLGTWNVMVLPASGSITTINASTVLPPGFQSTSPVSSVQLPITFTGAPYHPATSTDAPYRSTAASIKGDMTCILGSSVLLAIGFLVWSN
ncbi:hypothetical protein FRC20_001364, partial [Serendipita sp. 405]